MEPSVQVYWLPKDGNTLDEYEDAYGCSLETLQFAIADGATESTFAEIWSSILTRQFVSDPPKDFPPSTESLIEWLSPLQKEWHCNINWDHLPWYAEEKARGGAYATLLGIRFLEGEEEASQPKGGFFKKLGGLFMNDEEEGHRWQAITFGDSNLFHIRNNTLLRAWPINKSADFDSRPVLICSNPKKNHSLWPTVATLEGDYEPRDVFLLATDALAKWFLERCEKGEQPWRRLLSMKSDDDFSSMVDKLRAQKHLKNDDTTLIILEWPDSSDS